MSIPHIQDGNLRVPFGEIRSEERIKSFGTIFLLTTFKHLIMNLQFYTVQSWMITELKLKGIQRELFAIIFGFSQDGHSEFKGSLSQLCEITLASRPTVINALKELCEKELITKIVIAENGMRFSRYKANFTGSKEILPPVKKLYSGSKEILPHNNIYNNTSTITDVIDTGDIYEDNTTNLNLKKRAREKKLATTEVEKCDQRVSAFYDSLIPFVSIYGKELIRDFYEYWSERTESRTRMRRDAQKTWDLSRRLKLWARNNDNYEKRTSTTQSSNGVNRVSDGFKKGLLERMVGDSCDSSPLKDDKRT